MRLSTIIKKELTKAGIKASVRTKNGLMYQGIYIEVAGSDLVQTRQIAK